MYRRKLTDSHCMKLTKIYIKYLFAVSYRISHNDDTLISYSTVMEGNDKPWVVTFQSVDPLFYLSSFQTLSMEEPQFIINCGFFYVKMKRSSQWEAALHSTIIGYLKASMRFYRLDKQYPAIWLFPCIPKAYRGHPVNPVSHTTDTLR